MTAIRVIRVLIRAIRVESFNLHFYKNYNNLMMLYKAA